MNQHKAADSEFQCNAIFRKKKVKSKQIHLFIAAPVPSTLNWNLVIVFQHMKIEQKYQQNVCSCLFGGEGLPARPEQNNFL